MVYQQQGIEAMSFLRRVAFGQKWQFDFTEDSIDISIFDSSEGRMFRSEGLICSSAEDLFKFLYEDFESQSLWNPLVLLTEVIEYVDEWTDVTYTVTRDAAAGFISSRDYVAARRREQSGPMYMIASAQSEHQSRPETSDHIRCDYRLSGFIVAPSSDRRNFCTLTWINGSRAGGWVPRFLEEQATRKAAVEFHNAVRRAIAGRTAQVPNLATAPKHGNKQLRS